MTCPVFTKRPEDRLDYDLDYRRDRWLASGDTIATVDSVTVDAESGVVVDDTDFTSTVVKVWLSGGTLGKTATVTVKITTGQGREKELAFRVRIREQC